jgi:glycosyltransferase involved in cell wall biosynthesis
LKLSIVVPIYNESENIKNLNDKIVNVLLELNYEYEIIYVNDGSHDNSFELLNECRNENSNIKIINFKRNFGQTAALAAGIEHTSKDIIITMDGDGQNDPLSIPDLLAKLNEGYDLVAGWRKDRKDGFVLRKFPSLIANKLISFSTQVGIHDHGCTMRAVRKNALSELSLYGEQHRFISVLIAWSGAKFTEIPVKHNPRIYGKSNYGIMRTYKVLLDLFTLIFLRSYATKPIYLFGGTGIISIILSFVSVFIALYQKYFSSDHLSLINNPLLLLSVLFMVLGVMFVLIGLLAELVIRTYYETSKKNIYLIKDKIGFE